MSTPPARSPNVPLRAGTMMDEAGSSIFPADDPVSTPIFPAGVTAAHRSLEPFDEVRILGGEPHQSHSGTTNPSSVSE